MLTEYFGERVMLVALVLARLVSKNTQVVVTTTGPGSTFVETCATFCITVLSLGATGR